MLVPGHAILCGMVPIEAFYTPTDDDWTYNSDFWTGYEDGVFRAQHLSFPATGIDTYAEWRVYEEQFWKQPSLHVYPVAKADGYNEAWSDAGNYLWFKDPNSPHNKVVS